MINNLGDITVESRLHVPVSCTYFHLENPQYRPPDVTAFSCVHHECLLHG